METVDYLKILKNHWKVVACLTLVAVVLTFLASPKEASRGYVAEHVLTLNASEAVDSDTSAQELNRSQLYAQNSPVVLREAAELLGYQEGEDADELWDKMEATADSTNLSLTISGTDADPDRAVQIANAFALAIVNTAEQLQEDRDDPTCNVTNPEGDRYTAEMARTRLTQIQQALATGQGNAAALAAEQSALEGCLDDLAENAPAEFQYATLSEATQAERQSALFSTREQRMLLAAAVGALFGFGVAIVLDRNDSRVRTKEQAEKRFGLPVLAEVPQLPLRARNKAAVVSFEQEPRMAEAYRSLRTALLLFRRADDSQRQSGRSPAAQTNGNGSPHEPQADNRTQSQDGSLRQLVVVTSSEPGEGKSTTAANLAMAYAEAGHSVLLLTWDLWRPLSPAVFGAVDGPGVTDYLESFEGNLVPYVQDTAIPGVRIVTAGVGARHPSARLDMARKLLDEARELANVVVVDTAPLLSASVTRELATLADAVVVVCRSGRTTSDAAARCAELLERIGAPALGVVLVGVPTGAFADYYGPSRKAGYDRVVAGPRRKPLGPADKDDKPPKRTVIGGEGRHLRSTDPGPYKANIPASGMPGGRVRRSGVQRDR